MAVWLVRAGEDARYEARFFKDHRVYLTTDGLAGEDFTEIPDYAGIRKVLLGRFEGSNDIDIGTLADVVFEFVMSMTTQDFVITPRQSPDTLAIGLVVSPYCFDPAAESPYSHLHDVRWLALNIPTTAFNDEFQHYLNIPAPVAQIKVSNAIAQIRSLIPPQPEIRLEPQVAATTTLSDWPATPPVKSAPSPVAAMSALHVPEIPVKSTSPVGRTLPEIPASHAVDCVLENLGLEAISHVMAEDIEKHGLTDLIRATLKAGGMTIFPLDDDRDASLFMAASGAFGLDRPNTCVRVHPVDTVCDTLAFSQFFGAVQGHQSEQGLLVSWSGFDPQVIHDATAAGSRIRLWTRKDIVGHFLEHYASIESRIQQRMPLKRIWIPSNLP